MLITFYGATREVTGSMHLVTTNKDRILLDCGMFQGRRKESDGKNRIIPFDPSLITNVILSHAHIDHSGRLPLLAKMGYSGRVISTRATMDACEYLLPDAAHIQESDAQYLNYKAVRSALQNRKSLIGTDPKIKWKDSDIRKLLKKNLDHLNRDAIEEWIGKLNLRSVEPLYSSEDAESALKLFEGYPYRTPVTVGKGAVCVQYEAGHILGSAIAILRGSERGRKKTIGYTGDLGRFDKPIIKNPTLDFAEEDRKLDLLIMESTYGDREHEPVGELKPKLKEVFNRTFDREGCLVIPSFAFGRTQEILYVIHELYDEGSVPRLPVYIDSPLAIRITKVFGEHPEIYDRETHKTFLSQGKNPFFFKEVRYVDSVEESMRLMRETKPHVVISASGMCEAGRILHHLRYKIHNAKNTILIVGFMAEHTLGRRILEKGEEYAAAGRRGKPPTVRFLNKEYPLKAEVVQLDGFSAHADKNEMLQFLNKSNLSVKKIALVHGEEKNTLSFADFLKEKGYSVTVPKRGETISV